MKDLSTFPPFHFSTLQKTFARCKAEGRAAYVAYLTMGAPTLAKSLQAVETLLGEGVDILELGVPFADPVADGPVIRAAMQTALANGVTLADVLKGVSGIRARHPETPIVVFSYYSALLAYGLTRFADDAARCGADAVLIPDLPPESRGELLDALRAAGLTLVPLVMPDDGPDQIVASAKGLSDSFLYAVTMKGTTGRHLALSPALSSRLETIKRLVDIPVVAGFGIRTPEEGACVAAHCDGFVIGSALVERFMEASREEAS